MGLRANGWRSWSPGGPAKKSPVMIIAIVAAAIVLLAAVGGIIMVLTRGGGGEQPMSRSPRASPYRRQRSRPRSPRGSQRLRNRSPHPPRHRSRRLAAPSISATGSSSHRPAAGRSRRPARTWRSCPTGRASFSANRSRSRSPPTLVSCAMHGTAMSPRARPTASSRIEGRRVGTTRLKAATCVAEVTVSGGQGTTKLSCSLWPRSGRAMA